MDWRELSMSEGEAGIGTSWAVAASRVGPQVMHEGARIQGIRVEDC